MAASDNTAALVVALSAQLTKFEKDMKGAVDIAKKRTNEIENTFAKMNKAITGQLSNFSAGLAGNLGGFGSVLTRLGPAGLAAGAGLGAATLAMFGLIRATEQYVEELGRLKDAGETIGLTATQLKALERVGLEVGLSGEQINQFLVKFVAGVEELRGGSGQLFDALQKIDIELVKQFNAAKTTAEQIDVLAKAFSRLSKESEKVELLGGRRNAAFGRLLTVLPQRGGVAGVTAAIPNIDKSADQLDEIADKIALIKKDATDMLGRAFAPEILSVLTFTAEKMKALAEFVERTATGIRDLKRWFDEFASVNVPAVPEVGVNLEGRQVNVPLPQQRPKQAIELALTNEQELARLKAFVALAGDAATASEQLALKIREINAARDQGKITDDQAKRALDAANLASIVSIQQARERLGIATLENIVDTRTAQLKQEVATKRLTENEAIKAGNILLKEAKETADQMAVRQALLPGLKQLELDIANTNKEIDKFVVASLSNLENAFIDAASGTKTLADAFRDMVSSILKDIARLLIRQSVTGPLAALIGGAFKAPVAHTGGMVGKTGFPMRSVSPGAFVGAKHFASGGMVGGEVPIIAHRGEIVGWPDQLRKAFGSDGGVSVVNQIVVQGDASENTVKLIRSELSAYARGEPDRVIRAVRQARERNVKL